MIPRDGRVSAAAAAAAAVGAAGASADEYDLSDDLRADFFGTAAAAVASLADAGTGLPNVAAGTPGIVMAPPPDGEPNGSACADADETSARSAGSEDECVTADGGGEPTANCTLGLRTTAGGGGCACDCSCCTCGGGAMEKLNAGAGAADVLPVLPRKLKLGAAGAAPGPGGAAAAKLN